MFKFPQMSHKWFFQFAWSNQDPNEVHILQMADILLNSLLIHMLFLPHHLPTLSF